MRSRSYTLAVALAAGLVAHILGSVGTVSAHPAAPAGVVVARYGFDVPGSSTSVWVEPSLVMSVRYREWSAARFLRQCSCG